MAVTLPKLPEIEEADVLELRPRRLIKGENCFVFFTLYLNDEACNSGPRLGLKMTQPIVDAQAAPTQACGRWLGFGLRLGV